MATGGSLDGDWRGEVLQRVGRVGLGAIALIYGMVLFQHATGWGTFSPLLHVTVVVFGVFIAVAGWAPRISAAARLALVAAPGLVACCIIYTSVG